MATSGWSDEADGLAFRHGFRLCLTRFLSANRCPPPHQVRGRLSLENALLLHERTRRRQMQRKRIYFVAGARIDLAHDWIMAGDEAIGVAGKPLDDIPARRH